MRRKFPARPPPAQGRSARLKAGEHTRPGRCWPRLAASFSRAPLTQRSESFRCACVFREGAETAPGAGALFVRFWNSGEKDIRTVSDWRELTKIGGLMENYSRQIHHHRNTNAA